MRSTLLAILPSLAAIASTSASEVVTPRDNSDCADVHIFLARGNNEPYPGRQAMLVEAVCDGLDSCDYESLVYSALYTDLYCQTVYDGTIAGHTQMAAYASRCPDSKLVLGGYSQGAQIVTDILGGAGGTLYNGCIQPSIPAMSRDTAPGNMIVAAIVFGDVRHTASQDYNYGNGSAIDSEFPRTSTMLAALEAYSDVLRDWCLDTDPVCAYGQTVWYLSSHLDYFDLYSDAAASWIKSVASLTDDSTFTTQIATSISGTVQDYATIGTATPSGSVSQDTTWTLYTAVSTATSSASSPTSTDTSSAATSTTALITTSLATTAAGTSTSAAATTTAKSSASHLSSGISSTTLSILVAYYFALLVSV
ncbi:Alpha/Beta hydrolase protein [Xylariales sp. PMI_506]|nr:Alpha/Beta hydrolase protein [Xylariales sp. PMI_506]